MAFQELRPPNTEVEEGTEFIIPKDLTDGDSFIGFFKHFYVTESVQFGKQANYVFTYATESKNGGFEIEIDSKTNTTKDFHFYGNGSLNYKFLNGSPKDFDSELTIRPDKFLTIPFGTLIQIVYEGRKTSKQGQPMFAFKILVDFQIVNKRIASGKDVESRRLQILGSTEPAVANPQQKIALNAPKQEKILVEEKSKHKRKFEPQEEIEDEEDEKVEEDEKEEEVKLPKQKRDQK